MGSLIEPGAHTVRLENGLAACHQPCLRPSLENGKPLTRAGLVSPCFSRSTAADVAAVSTLAH